MAGAAVVETDTTQGQPDGDEQASTARRVVAPTHGAGTRRRTVDVQIGEYEYDARCPKLVIWTDLATLVESQAPQGGNRADRRRKGGGAAPGGRITTDRVRLTQALSHFLAGCLSVADWQHVESQLADSDSDVDVPDLWSAAMALIVEFEPDMRAMAEKIGMRVPKSLDKMIKRAADADDDQAAEQPVEQPVEQPTARRKSRK